VQILGRNELAQAKALKVVADVNAVPPAGIEGLGISDMAKPLGGTGAVGFGPCVYERSKSNLPLESVPTPSRDWLMRYSTPPFH